MMITMKVPILNSEIKINDEIECVVHGIKKIEI
jgi:hypothetical protein